MNILFLASSSDFHVDKWVKYFNENNKTFLFSDSQNYLEDQKFYNVKIFKSSGYLGFFLNCINSKKKKLFQINKLISVMKFAREIDCIVKKYNINIIHAHSLYFGYLNYYIKSQIPKVFTPMGSDIIIHSQNNYIYKNMAKKAYIGSDIITGDSIFLQKKGFILGAKKENNYIIQNGVDTNIFYLKKNNFKQKLDLNESDLLLFSPRGLDPIYNIKKIIYSIKILVDKKVRLKCIFAYGFGDKYYESLNKIVNNLNLEDYIIWLSNIDLYEMAKIYNASDIVISIPNSDSSPASVYEAMFCKKPVIISDLEWSNEYFKNRKNVFKIKEINSKELAKEIEHVISSPNKTKIITENAYKIVKKFFDYRKNMKKLENIMEMKIKK